MSEEQLTATTDEVVASDVAVDTDIELEEEEVQEIVSPEVAAFRADSANRLSAMFILAMY